MASSRTLFCIPVGSMYVCRTNRKRNVIKPLQNKYGAMLRPWDQTHPWTRSRSIVRVHRRRHLTNWCFLPVQMTDTAHSIENCPDAGKGCHTGTTQHFLLRQQRVERYSKGPRSGCGKPVRWLAGKNHSSLAPFAGRQAPLCSPPFEFAVSRGPRVWYCSYH